MENIKLFHEQYELIPIGTKGYINCAGTIYAVRLSRRILQRNTNPCWVDLYNVWQSPMGSEFWTQAGNNVTRINGEWVNITNTIEGAKRNEKGIFPYETILMADCFASKYGMTKNNFRLSELFAFKMVNGFPRRYQLSYDMEVDGDRICVTIPDFENGIAFVSEEECRENTTYKVVEFDERSEALHEIKAIRDNIERISGRLEDVIDKHVVCGGEIMAMCIEAINMLLDKTEEAYE